MTPADKEKERVKFNTEILKILSFGVVTTAGGTITLYIQQGPDAFTVLGIIFVVLMGLAGWAVFLHTLRMLE